MPRISCVEVDDHELNNYLEEAHIRAGKTGVLSVIKTNAGYFQFGDVFEAETVKGNKNYIIFAFIKGGMVYYFHGDRALKVSEQKFQSLIDYGDLIPVPKWNQDPEKMSLSVLGLKAMSNGMPFEDYLKVAFNYGNGSEIRS